MNKTIQQDNYISISSKEDIMLKSLKSFYKNDLYVNRIIPIITGTSQISLRVLDWFVTNYAKTFNISYMLNGEQFYVYRDYKAQLKSYNKRFFDPFCRRSRVNFNFSNSSSIITTIGQLNFFKWAVKYEVLDYIENQNNLKKIINHMNTCNKERKIKTCYKKQLKHNNETISNLKAESTITNEGITVKIKFSD
jgi:uncharacterized protein YlbG (UPF0298 family)